MWNILGIEPTKDIREIKRAYARLAKQYNPEEHPEEFKRIFDAYKSASALARSVNERRSDPIVTITAAATEAKEQQELLQHEQHEQSQQPEFNFTSVDIFPDFEITPQLAQEKFLQNMALILSDKNKRDDISCWKWLLGKPTFLSVCDDKGFRKKAQKLLDKELLAPNVSSYIASRFSRGSRALPQKKGDKWAVYISHSGKKPPESYKVPSYMGGPSLLYRTAPQLMTMVIISLIFFALVLAGSLLQQYFS